MTKAEKEILKKIKKGDKKAFEIIYNSYYRVLVDFSVLYTKDIFLSEEIVNDFFTRFWEKRQIITINTNLAAYLYKSIKHMSLNKIKANKKHIIEKLKEELEEYSKCTPETYLQNKEEQAHTENLLKLIPPRTREIFIMSKYDKLKYKEIAEILNISINTVENHMVKAIKILRNYYKNHKD